MKQSYPHYGKRTKELEANLLQQDREIFQRFLSYCAMRAGPKQLAKLRLYLLQFRDVVEKPLDKITKDEAIHYWGLVHRAPYEEHTKVAMRKTVKRFLKWYYRDMEMIESLTIPRHYVNKKKVNKAALIKPEELRLMLHSVQREFGTKL